MKNDPVQHSARLREDEYFQKVEREHQERVSQEAQRQLAERLLAEASGTADPNLLSELRALGYTHETAALLTVVPLVQVAWQSGWIRPRERELILATAHRQGVTGVSVSYRRLMSWMDHRPSEQFFQKTLHLIRRCLDALPAEEQQARKRDLLSRCLEIASASGGMLGFGSKISRAERRILQELAAQLDHPLEARASG
jgi:hypothetical protein